MGSVLEGPPSAAPVTACAAAADCNLCRLRNARTSPLRSTSALRRVGSGWGQGPQACAGSVCTPSFLQPHCAAAFEQSNGEEMPLERGPGLAKPAARLPSLFCAVECLTAYTPPSCVCSFPFNPLTEHKGSPAMAPGHPGLHPVLLTICLLGESPVRQFNLAHLQMICTLQRGWGHTPLPSAGGAGGLRRCVRPPVVRLTCSNVDHLCFQGSACPALSQSSQCLTLQNP